MQCCVKPAPPLPVMSLRLPVIDPLSPQEPACFCSSTSFSSLPRYAAERPSGYTAVSGPPIKSREVLLISQDTFVLSTSMYHTNCTNMYFSILSKICFWYGIMNKIGIVRLTPQMTQAVSMGRSWLFKQIQRNKLKILNEENWTSVFVYLCLFLRRHTALMFFTTKMLSPVRSMEYPFKG